MIDSLLSRQEKVWSGPVTSELPNRAKSQSDPSLLDLLVSSSYSLSPLLPSPSIASYPPSFFLLFFLFFSLFFLILLMLPDLLLAVFDTLPQSILTSFR